MGSRQLVLGMRFGASARGSRGGRRACLPELQGLIVGRHTVVVRAPAATHTTLEIARAWAATSPKAGNMSIGSKSMSLAGECKAMQETLQERCGLRSQSLPWQRSIHDPVYRLSTTTCMSRSPGVDSLRSEPCGFEAPFTMHDTVCRLPRIPLLRGSMNKGKKRKDRARRRRSGVLVENKDSGPPFGQDESLLL